jgi:hypothetical protein
MSTQVNIENSLCNSTKEKIQMRIKHLFATVAALITIVSLIVAIPAAASPSSSVGAQDDKVSGQTYVRYDGGTDQAIDDCNNPDPEVFGALTQNNEPFSVVDPQNPDLVLSGWNDYCSGWMGLGFSTNGGQTWTNSLVPGYPADTSTGGMASPEYLRTTEASDPLGAFDLHGRFYFGAIAYNGNAGPKTNADIFVARYNTTPNGDYPLTYLGTTRVENGTPSANFLGRFNDKPMLEVDRTGGTYDGNVYMCWSRFVGNGQNKIYFSRSADQGLTFSKPAAISTTPSEGSHAVQGCDIAVEHDGDVHVIWRTIDTNSSKTTYGIGYSRSTDGGLSFSKAKTIQRFTIYLPFDTSRDCGDGPFLCPSEFVFHRVPLEPRITSDPTGELPGVFVMYNAVDPDTIVPSDTSYFSTGIPGTVGQSKVYVAHTTDDGATWTAAPVADGQAGHQYFPDGDALAGRLAIVWQDNSLDPAYSVQLPVGNTAGAVSSGTEVLNTWVAVSSDGVTFGSPMLASSVGQQPQYEMFGSRDIPFLGDYNWIQLVDVGEGALFGYMTWTDNRDVLPGDDPREEVQDGFDVNMCVAQLPDGTFGPNTCPNSGGLDQSIYGNTISIP